VPFERNGLKVAGNSGRESEMKEKIGETAGRIWQELHQTEEVSVSRLPKILHERDAVVYQALGWLAREDKVQYRTKGNRTSVSLN
jgi:hypothetical protein